MNSIHAALRATLIVALTAMLAAPSALAQAAKANVTGKRKPTLAVPKRRLRRAASADLGLGFHLYLRDCLAKLATPFGVRRAPGEQRGIEEALLRR